MPPTRRSLQDSWSRVVATARAHPWVTAVLALGVVVSVVLSVLVGLNLVVTFGLLAIIGAGAVVLMRWWTRRRSQDPPRSAAATGRVALAFVACSGLLTFAVIQLVPYGRAHANPPVTGEPQWADDRTRELMVTACFSCHSNEVDYPPYASVAPVSWLVQRHVDEGRSKVNYSEFATDPGEADESVEVVEEGEMPPSYFTRFGLHADADLTAAEVEELIDGLRATPGMDGD
jgi:mono/diheme cytochrome c family protein